MRKNQIMRIGGCLALLAGFVSTKAQILVGPTGSPAQDFSTQPPITSWSTFTGAGAQADFSAAATLDAQIQAATWIGNGFVALGSSGTQPPSVANIARRNTATTGLYLQSRPNNATAYVLTMATLQNDTGGNVAFLNVEYDFNEVLQAATGVVRAEEVPGFRAFFSLTGDPNTWVAIPEFSTASPGKLTASLTLGTWAQGTPLYILWADDDAIANNTAPNVEAAYTIDNFVAVPSAGREPGVTAFRSDAYKFVMELTDGTPPLTIKESSITATLNGGDILPVTFTKNGDAVTISDSWTTPLASGSTNTVVLTFTDNSTPANTYTNSRTFVVAPYTVIPASYSVTGVDTTSSGFSALMHQIGGTRRPDALPGAGLFDQNSTASAETQLANGFNDPNTMLPYDNIAVPNPESPDGRYTVTNVNWNQDIPPAAAAAGSFSDLSIPPAPDEPFPGIVNTPDNIVSELLTFVELKAGRIYRMGVNSDDGFKVTIGTNPSDVSAPVLASFSGGRGVADSLFDFRVEADGIYPMRLLWWEGTGGAALEWFTVDDLGNKILLNDRTNPAGVKTYSKGAATPAYVKSVTPYPGQTNLTGGLVLTAVIADGTTTVLPAGVKLFVNNVDVTSSATVIKDASATTTKVTYDPPGTLAPATVLNVRLVYTDSVATTQTNDFTMSVFPQILVDVDDTRIWKYNDTGDDLLTDWRARTYDDSMWPGEGPALLGFESTSVEPMRTTIRRTRDSDGTQPTTYYFRTHFNFTGNPATVNLLLRHVVDDGAVFYLNGQELHRFGLAAGAAYTAASFFTGHENVWEGPFPAPRASLISGDNVLAVEVHQSDATSSDVVMGPQLFFVPDPNAIPAHLVSFTPLTNSINQATNQTLTFLLEEGTTTVNASTIKLTVNGQVVTPVIDKPAGGILTTVSYTPPGNGYTPESIVSGTLEFSDSAAFPTVAPFSFQIAPSLEPIFLVDETSTTLPTQMWKYLNTGEDMGTAWTAKTFDDSLWPEGAPLFGAEETGATVAPQRTATLTRTGLDGIRITTDYFRTYFTLTNDPATTRLAIRHAVDDGLVMFINGQQVYSFGFDPGLTTITYTNVTITDHENRWEGPFIIPNGGLTTGSNVVAVEVHQNANSSSDMVFGLELYRVTSTAPQPTETRFQTTTFSNGQVSISWSGPGTLQETSTLDAPGTPAVWTTVQNPSNPYNVLPSGTAKFYRVQQ